MDEEAFERLRAGFLKDAAIAGYSARASRWAGLQGAALAGLAVVGTGAASKAFPLDLAAVFGVFLVAILGAAELFLFALDKGLRTSLESVLGRLTRFKARRGP